MAHQYNRGTHSLTDILLIESELGIVVWVRGGGQVYVAANEISLHRFRIQISESNLNNVSA